ncbi:hypothetical protein BOX15_Mlig003133g1, partial [Macrostomum lignano]
ACPSMISEASAQRFAELELECSSAGSLFANLVCDMKTGIPLYEELINKAQKLNGAFKVLLTASSAFLDSFQKIADLASSTHGSTKDMGASLTRICLKQRTIESRMRAFSGHLQDSLATPMADKLDDWRRSTGQLEKDRLKELKRHRAEAKKASSESVRLSKKRQSASGGRRGSELEEQLERAMGESHRMQARILDVEQRWLRRARHEGRSRLCFFLACLKPALDILCNLTDEFGHLRDLAERLGQEATPEPPPSPPPQAARGASRSSSSAPSPAPSLNSLGSADSYCARAPPPGAPGGVLLPGMPAHTLRPGSHGASSDSGFISQELPAPPPQQQQQSQQPQAVAPPAPQPPPPPPPLPPAQVPQQLQGRRESPVVGGTAAGAPGGGETEESSGGDSEDEEDQSLYPDQGLPAPVYSNLSELQRTAKRKFSITGGAAGGLLQRSAGSAPAFQQQLQERRVSADYAATSAAAAAVGAAATTGSGGGHTATVSAASVRSGGGGVGRPPIPPELMMQQQLATHRQSSYPGLMQQQQSAYQQPRQPQPQQHSFNPDDLPPPPPGF